MFNFKQFLFFLTSQERKQAGILLLLITIMAIMEMVGVASILPFIAVLSNPSSIDTNLILIKLFQFSKLFGIETKEQFLLALGLAVFFILVISLLFKALTNFIQIKFVQRREYSIGKRLVEGYLHQPYSWFLHRNSADLGKTILSEVSQVIQNGISPMIEMISRAMVATLLIFLLLLSNPTLALISGLFLGGAYSIFYMFTRTYVSRIGKERLKSNEERFIAISEAFNAAKEIKVRGLEKKYVKKFSSSASVYARNQALVLIIAQLPRFIFEIIAFGGILIILLFLISETGSLNNSLPTISLFIFACYRLMPALQQIYVSFTKVNYIKPSLNKLYYDVINLKNYDNFQDTSHLKFNKSIVLNNIYFDYPNSSRTTLKDINLTIHAKSTIGLIGTTGSGKTTTIDIILGLLFPQKGNIEIDSQIITNKNIRSWQKIIGYVPQQIYLSDDTIISNIAFGIDQEDIDYQAVIRASKIANLHKFVTEELDDQYNTRIGERGIRLSGGQRQRIGIARALYHKPQLLILDEATSSLDNLTEQVVMDAVNNLHKDITIILVAHRLNTVKNCDMIYKFEKGKIIDHGKFEDITK